ncbi:MAG: ribosomal protection-like ABC-F family protein [Chloroflexota bacterium]|jgi:ATP-binding cassette subfamily F protein 3
MLSVQNISKTYIIDPILVDVSFTLNPGQRIGLVGANGCGKTTLLRILAGEEKADRGVIRINPPDLRVGYLPQSARFEPDDSLECYLQRLHGDPTALSQRLAELAGALIEHPQRADLQAEYDWLLVEIESAAQSAAQSARVLASLGLDHLPPSLPVSALSGGQKTRLALAGLLIHRPRLLLLDEPTNHLDVDMLEWLEDWLAEYNGAALVVSHDRAFLDQVATHILAIDAHAHTARLFEGNYSAYLETTLAERERQWQAYRDQQDEITRLRAAAARLRSRARFHKGGKADPAITDGFSAGFFANRAKETVQKAKNIEKRVQRLLTEERIDKPARSWEMKIDFGDLPESGRDALVLEHLSAGYPGNRLLDDLNLTLRYGSRTALLGRNGCGKTTLLRTIAGLIPPLEGRSRLGSGVRAGYMAQEQENLAPHANALETIQGVAALNETNARAFLSQFLFKGDDVFIPAGQLSFGERARLILAMLVAQGCNLLLLDEPINHLDIPARTRFEESLKSFRGTVLAVVHDRYFLESFATQYWQVQRGRISVIDQPMP